MSDVHETAERGFGSGSDAYERGRPGYPAAALEWLAEHARLGPGLAVVDVGAGTGKLTRSLAASGAEVIAIEPVAAMRAALEQSVVGVRALAGSAEALPLGDASADLITVAQAFHWFDGPRALREFSRVLRPGGHLALIWNRRRRSEEPWRGVDAIMKPHQGQTPRHESGAWREALTQTTLFRPAGELCEPWEQTTDADGLVDRVLSTSFIAALGEREREAVERAVRALPAAQRDPVLLGYSCEVALYERA